MESRPVICDLVSFPVGSIWLTGWLICLFVLFFLHPFTHLKKKCALDDIKRLDTWASCINKRERKWASYHFVDECKLLAMHFQSCTEEALFTFRPKITTYRDKEEGDGQRGQEEQWKQMPTGHAWAMPCSQVTQARAVKHVIPCSSGEDELQGSGACLLQRGGSCGATQAPSEALQQNEPKSTFAWTCDITPDRVKGQVGGQSQRFTRVVVVSWWQRLWEQQLFHCGLRTGGGQTRGRTDSRQVRHAGLLKWIFAKEGFSWIIFHFKLTKSKQPEGGKRRRRPKRIIFTTVSPLHKCRQCNASSVLLPPPGKQLELHMNRSFSTVETG